MKKTRFRRHMPMAQRIIYIPLVAIALIFIVVGYVSIQSAKASLMQQMASQAESLAHQMAQRIGDHRDAQSTIDQLLEEKIGLIGLAIANEKSVLNHLTLNAYAQRYQVKEINWFDEEGKILASSIPKYEGWIAPEGHPVQEFVNMSAKIWSEPIRKDSNSNRFNKYGYYRNVDQTFLQIALPADTVEALKHRFSEDYLVRALSKYEGIAQVNYLDSSFNILASASSMPQSLMVPLTQDAQALLNLGQVYALESQQANTYDVYVPIMDQGRVVGHLAVAFKMQQVNHAIIQTAAQIVALGILALIVVGSLMEWLLKSYVAHPIDALSKAMSKINIEKDITYRLPILDHDPFKKLRAITNEVLNITKNYFEEIIAHQEELIAANEELEATIGQLCASEEELRAQYDEIEAYAYHMGLLKQRYAIAIETTGCYIWEYHYQQDQLSISDNLVTYLGLSEDRFDLDTFVKHHIHEEDRRFFVQHLSNLTIPLLVGSEAIHFQMRLIGQSGEWQWYLMRGSISQDAASGQKIISGVMVDIHHQKVQEEYIQYLAEHDTLTGLLTRRKFEEIAAQSINAGQKGALLLIDIDNFKYINDYYGHLYGDQVLRHFSQRLSRFFDQEGSLYRLGGDEFIVHLTDKVDRDLIQQMILTFAQTLNENQWIEGFEQRLTLSTGVAVYPQDASRVEDLLMKADMAMYQAKKSGKNKHYFYSDDLQQALEHRLQVENHLRHALANNGFEVHYQPVIDAITNRIAYFEALIRLRDAVYTPTDLVNIAEESGIIHVIGEWVLVQVVEQLALWKKMGKTLCPVAVNLSPRQMMDPKLVQTIDQVLRRFKIPAHYLEIEITENILVENRAENLKTLEALRKLGIRIALDDFGTGYSSLNYLTFIPVDKIKLDKSLKDKFIDLESIQVMDSLISLAHGLQLKVVAEGVESELERKRLLYGKCDYLQGYFFSKPLSALDAGRWLVAHEMAVEESIQYQVT